MRNNSKLEKLIAEANKKLGEAQDARRAVLEYLEDNYEIDTLYEMSYLEDDCSFCFGLNEEHIQELVEERVFSSASK